MGNLLCPPTRPAFDPDWERRRRRSASGTRGDGDPANPTLLPVEVNALAIEEFHDDATMRSWPVKRLMEELKQARRNAPADKSILDGPMPLEKEELVAALRFARGGTRDARATSASRITRRATRTEFCRAATGSTSSAWISGCAAHR